MIYLFAFLGAGAAFLILDLIWLGLIAQNFYANQMGPLKADQFHIPGAVAFYVIFLIGLIFFAIAPALASASLSRALLLGAAFGFFCYATYDLTCLAVMRDYPAKLALVDIAWGTFLTASASVAGYLVATRFSG